MHMTDEISVERLSDVEHEEPEPAVLSFAGGAVGTIAGLKSGGFPGAIAGGLVGGTTGYLVGAAAQDAARSSGAVGTDTDPIEIDVADARADDSDDATGSNESSSDDESTDETEE